MRAGAQATLGIGAGRQVFGIDDTVCTGYTDVYSVYVKNKGNAAYTGTVYLYTYVDSSNGFLQDGSFDTAFVSLAPGDSVQMYHTHAYDTMGVFRAGGNIVVIWPSGNSISTVDSSLLTPVDMEICSGVNDITQEHSVVLFPNPSDNDIFIRNENEQNEVVRIRVLDISGREVAFYHNAQIISVRSLSPGLYFLEATFRDHSREIYRIQRE